MSVDPRTHSLFAAIAAVNYTQVKRLIESGVSVNSLNDRGKTPLAVACSQGHLDIVDLLVASGARMYPLSDVAAVEPEHSQVVSESGNWDFTSQEHEVSESPIRDREIPYGDLVDLIHPPSQSTQVVDGGLTASVALTPSQNLSKMAAAWGEMESEVDATHTFDLDEAFAAIDNSDPKFDRVGIDSLSVSDMFVDSELTMTYLDRPTVSIQLDDSETYAFDLSNDLLRDAFVKLEEPDRLLSNVGEWEEGETYAIDLNNLSGDGSETYAIDLDSFLGEDSVANDGEFGKFDCDEDRFDDECDEGATYAFELDDLDPLQLMGGENTTPNPPQYILPEIESRLLPVIGGDRQDNTTNNFGSRADLDVDRYSYEDRERSGWSSAANDNTPNKSLLTAVMAGDLDLVRQAIEMGANLDCYDWDLGYSPLGMAIERGHLDIVRYLLDTGANPQAGSTTSTALGLAAEQGETQMIQLLLSSGVDVNAPVAADGWTALLSAIKNGYRSLVPILVNAGANVNVWSRGETAILLAAKVQERDIYQYLYPLVNRAIRLCADRDGEQLLQSTLKRRTREQNHLAEKFIEMAAAGNSQEVRQAIASGIDINAFCANGHTALMAAAYYGQKAIVKILLAAGAEPNLLSDGDDGLGYGMSALMFVANSFFASNRDPIVQLLIEAGADVDLQGEDGKTAMMYAALAGSGYRTCVEILIAAGADLDLRDNCGHTALTKVAAAENYPMFNLLLQAGASTKGLESIQLIQAARSGNVDRVKSLLSTNDLNLNLDRGDAIGSAAVAGHTEIVELLIQAGAKLDLSDRSGFTPLASAAYAGYAAIVELLLDAGADLHAPPGIARSYSALEYAQMGRDRFTDDPRQHDRIIRQLQRVEGRG